MKHLISISILLFFILKVNAKIDSIPKVLVTGNVYNLYDNEETISNAQIEIVNSEFSYEAETDSLGNFSIDIVVGDYEIFAGKWGYRTKKLEKTLDGIEPLSIGLRYAYRDDFVLDLGWKTSADSSTTSGFWEFGTPNPTFLDNEMIQIDRDIPGELGNKCYVTGNLGGAPEKDDLDGGCVSLTSPVMDLIDYDFGLGVAFVHHYYFYSDDDSSNSKDSIQFTIDNGIDKIEWSEGPTGAKWKWRTFFLTNDLLTITENMTFSISVCDHTPDNIIEAGFDGFGIGVVGLGKSKHQLQNVDLEAFPNPFSQNFNFKYQLENNNANLLITNILGQKIETHQLNGNFGNIQLGSEWISGVYFARITQDGKTSEVLKIVKQ